MLDKNTLRHLIRDVIAEEVAAIKSQRPSTAGLPTMSVAIATDADLIRFAQTVLRLADEPRNKEAILAGKYPFQLTGTAGTTARSQTNATPAAAIIRGGGQSHRIDKGLVTEAVLAKLPPGTKHLILAAAVNITPLARDKAKALNISIERIGQ